MKVILQTNIFTVQWQNAMLGSWSSSRTTDLRVGTATPQQAWSPLQPRHTSLYQRSAVQSQSLLPRIIIATTPLRAGPTFAPSTQWITGLSSGFHLFYHGSDVVTMMVRKDDKEVCTCATIFTQSVWGLRWLSQWILDSLQFCINAY